MNYFESNAIESLKVSLRVLQILLMEIYQLAGHKQLFLNKKWLKTMDLAQIINGWE